MQIVSVEALLSINETIIVQLISFLIFLFIINRVMFRPLRGLMKQRADHVSKIKSDVLAADNEYEQIFHQINERGSAVKSEAFAIREKLEKSGAGEASEIIASARQDIADLKKKMDIELENQISKAREYIETESEALASSVMEKILGRRLNF
jgi:F-type H+-transporting ATPase subunit b